MDRTPPPPIAPLLVEIFEILVHTGLWNRPLRKIIEHDFLLEQIAVEGQRRAIKHRQAAQQLREQIDRLEPWMVATDDLTTAEAHETRAHQLEHLA